MTIRTLGLMHTADEFNDLIIKEENNRIVRFSDIGRAELGPADIKSYMKMNGVPMVGVVVIPQPGANHIEIADAVYQRMEQMKKTCRKTCTIIMGLITPNLFVRLSMRLSLLYMRLLYSLSSSSSFPARLACDTGTMYRDSRFPYRSILRYVSGGILY